MKQLRKLISILLITQLLFILITPLASAKEPPNFANCRFGVAGSSSASGYDLDQLNLGRYLHYGSRSSRPSGLPADTQYIHIVRVHQDKVNNEWNGAYVSPPTYTVTPDIPTLKANLATLTGSLVFIGNEIDRKDFNGGGQDEMTPALYAKAYNDIYTAIKEADPTAIVGPASVIQATSLRLLYLDQVWDSYYSQFGHSMGDDIDAWNVHGFIIREVYESWGAEIPPGLVPGIDYQPEEGFLYGENSIQAISDAHHDPAHFIQFTRNMRAWMAEKGERNKPLINTEMGVLYRTLNEVVVADAEVNEYMNSTFDFMMNTTDNDIGYPADNNRLVQGWIWFSMISGSWNGALFNSNKELTSFGTNYKNYVTDDANHPLAAIPQQNLAAVNLRTEPAQYIMPTGPVTFTLKADIANNGNSPTTTGNNIVVRFFDGDPAVMTSTEIYSETIKDLPGCGEFKTVETKWPNQAGTGANTWYVKVDTIGGETATDDNIANDTGTIVTSAPIADLSLTKAVDNNTPTEVWDKYKYIIKVTNPTGEAVKNVVVNDPLPGGTVFSTYDSSQGVYFSSGPWQVGTLAANSTATLTITAKVENNQAGTTITNTATITQADVVDAQGNNNTAHVSIVPAPDGEAYMPLIIKQ